MPDTADPAETLGLIKGLAEVVKSHHSAHKAEQEAHLNAMKATNEHIMEVSSKSPRVPPRDRVGDLPVFCARGVGHLPFIFARG